MGILQKLFCGLRIQHIRVPGTLPLNEIEQLPGPFGRFPGDDLIKRKGGHQIHYLIISLLHVLQLNGTGIDRLRLLQVIIAGVRSFHKSEKLSRQIPFHQFQIHIGQFGMILHNGLSAGTAGPVILVIDPYLQTHLLGFLNGKFHPVQPVFIHISQLFADTETGMDIQSRASLFLIFFQLVLDFLIFHFPVPEPKGHNAEFFARGSKFIPVQRLPAH